MLFAQQENVPCAVAQLSGLLKPSASCPPFHEALFFLLSRVLRCLPPELQMVTSVSKPKCNKSSRLVFGQDWVPRLFNWLLWKTHQPTSPLTREQWFHPLTNKAFVMPSLHSDSSLFCAFVSEAKQRIHNPWQFEYLDFPLTQFTY